MVSLHLHPSSTDSSNSMFLLIQYASFGWRPDPGFGGWARRGGSELLPRWSESETLSSATASAEDRYGSASSWSRLLPPLSQTAWAVSGEQGTKMTVSKPTFGPFTN